MTPYEILLSESQERMLVVAAPAAGRGRAAGVREWELSATPIGRVTDDGIFRVSTTDSPSPRSPDSGWWTTARSTIRGP